MNPFEDENETFLVLTNAEGQHSLWPAWKAVPAGWVVRHGPSSKADCANFVRETWTSMRPRLQRQSEASLLQDGSPERNDH